MHWRQLAEQFQKAFRQVYARQSAAVLWVYGPQGAGKSMFCTRLAEDYARTRDGESTPDLRNNLWHILTTTDRPEAEALREVTSNTALKLIDERTPPDWLGVLKTFAKEDSSRVRLFLCDDAHKNGVMRPWTNLSAKDFEEASQSSRDALLGHIAERINDACRHEFQRSIFVMLSIDKEWVATLHRKLENSFKELTTMVLLPVPHSPSLERILQVKRTGASPQGHDSTTG